MLRKNDYFGTAGDDTRVNWVYKLARDCEALCTSSGRTAAEAAARGRVAFDELDLVYQTTGASTRRQVLHLLSLLPCDESLPRICAALARDKCPIVRHEAAYYLGQLRDHRGVNPLVAAMRCDPDALVRHEAAEALGDMGATQAYDALAEACGDPSEVVRRTAAMARHQLKRPSD